MIIEHLGWEKSESGKLVLKQKLIVEVDVSFLRIGTNTFETTYCGETKTTDRVGCGKGLVYTIWSANSPGFGSSRGKEEVSGLKKIECFFVSFYARDKVILIRWRELFV